MARRNPFQGISIAQMVEEIGRLGEKNVKGGIDQVADRPRILVILPSALHPLLINLWSVSLWRKVVKTALIELLG